MSETKKKTVLLVEDVPSQAELYASYLRVAGFAVITAETGQQALTHIEQEIFDAIVLDLNLPDMNGMEILTKVRKQYSDLPIIVATADTSAQTAVKAMQEGATDFIIKPFPAARLVVTLQNAIQQHLLQTEIVGWRQSLGQTNYQGFVGRAATMQAVYRVIESVASSKANVFIIGDSGTGKELAASAIHQASPRREKPFVAINCGAIPRDLLESQIFGHIKGAFTGAIANQIGAAKKADGGTLFLDEVCELPLDLQVKLLRFLQTGDVAPVGSDHAEHVDIRIIAATNREPLDEVKAGRFREDLYYRLHVVPLEIPALRDRDDDVVLLAEHFLKKFNLEENKKFSGFAPDVLQIFRRYEWPGNVRQLENVIHQIVVLQSDDTVRKTMLPDMLAHFTVDTQTVDDAIACPYQPPAVDPAVLPLWQVEKNAILQTLKATNQDVVKAAALLEVSPSTLYRKLQMWKSQTAV